MIILIISANFIYIVYNWDEINLFKVDEFKTILLFWIEIQVWSTPVQFIYYIFTLYHLMINQKRKRDNLNNPMIKEALEEGTGLQEQMDEYIMSRVASRTINNKHFDPDRKMERKNSNMTYQTYLST